VALKVLAMGGIYLGGGVSPKILKTLGDGTFAKAFLDKGGCLLCWRRFRCG